MNNPNMIGKTGITANATAEIQTPIIELLIEIIGLFEVEF